MSGNFSIKKPNTIPDEHKTMLFAHLKAWLNETTLKENISFDKNGNYVFIGSQFVTEECRIKHLLNKIRVTVHQSVADGRYLTFNYLINFRKDE